MAFRGMLLQQQVLFGALIFAAVAAAQPNLNCSSTCGSLYIQYPFGTSEGCYLDPSFLITCNDSFNPPKPFLGISEEEVLSISLDGEVRVSSPVARDCPQEPGYNPDDSSFGFGSANFPISHTKNKFVGVGCDTLVLIAGEVAEKNYTTGCLAFCDTIDGGVVNGSCKGTGCCQSSLPEGMYSIGIAVSSLYNLSEVPSFNPCAFGFVIETAYNFSSLDIANFQNRSTVPLVLDWAVGNETCPDAKQNMTSYACKAEQSECYNPTDNSGYRCNCSSGYQGNPYLFHGCQDVNECEISNPCVPEANCNNTPGSFECYCPKGQEGDGKTTGKGCRPKGSDSRSVLIALCIAIVFLVLVVGGFCMYWGLKRRQLFKLREKLFQQNGGTILQQQLLNYNESVEPTKIFSIEELKKATNNYNESMIIGQGGNGIVYKGILPGNKVVAIKKSKVFDQSQVKQFINEVFILTQINHRNVVKLLGCCLETEVPLLVYEFITNGTLFHHIHNDSLSNSLSWEQRLKIAAETAGALAYLHFEASMPIIHRDVKPANILLDDNLIAKVADFGASRLISIDEKQVTTLVQGTHGYLDPESFQTGQLTEQSDVYSFGVVLAELLTSKKVVFSDGTGNDRKLAVYFVSAIKEDQLLQILDPHIMEEKNIQVLKEVANLVRRCLSIKGEDRPSMREVAMELEGLRIMKKHSWGKTDVSIEETEYLLAKPVHSFNIDFDIGSSATSATIGYDSITNHELKALDDGR